MLHLCSVAANIQELENQIKSMWQTTRLSNEEKWIQMHLDKALKSYQDEMTKVKLPNLLNLFFEVYFCCIAGAKALTKG